MRLAAGWALMLTLSAGAARGAEPSAGESCRGPNIVLAPSLSHHRSWRAAAGDTRRRVAELADVDACTELEVEQAGGAVHVRASVADGRSVVRELSGPSELEPTVVALLVLPPVERSEELGADTESADRAAAVAAATTAKPNAEPAPAKPAAKPPSFTNPQDQRDQAGGARTLAGSEAPRAFELTLAGSGRAAGYLTGPGASALIDWRFGRWLLGANIHAEQATGPSSAGRFSAVRTASLGAWFGRRIVARPFYLDAGLELPIVAVSVSQWTSQETVTTPVTTPASGDDSGELGGESEGTTSTTTTTSSTRTSTQTTPPIADLRAGGLVRGVVPFAGGFGAVLAADAEHSLGLVQPPKMSGQPAALGWNFGLSLGVFWSTR